MRWRIADKEWHNEPLGRKLWYKDFIENGDLLELDNPKENDVIKIFIKTDDWQVTEVSKNSSGEFKIGQIIFANDNNTEINVFATSTNNRFILFTIATKEHFVEDPIVYRNGRVYWDVEDTFIGDKENDFFITIKSDNNNIRRKISNQNCVISDLHEEICKYQVKIRNRNIFTHQNDYCLIFENNLIVGRIEQFRFYKKRIVLISANCNNKSLIKFSPSYYIDNLQYIDEGDNVYYQGRLCVIDKTGKSIVLNNMINENQTYVRINPVRIELRDKYTLWLVAGYEGGDEYIGDLFCDIARRGICNIAKENSQFSEIMFYKYTEEEYV